MTSLNMNGFSISALELGSGDSQVVIDLLDQYTNAPAWPKTYSCDLDTTSTQPPLSDIKNKSFTSESKNEYFKYNEISNAELLKLCLKTIAQDLITAKQYLNELDSGCGDGDCGNSLAKVSGVIQDYVNNDENQEIFNYPHKVTQFEN